MKVSDFKVFLTQMEAEEHEIMYTKGTEYTLGSDDKLANFKNVASTTGLTPLQVWSVYFQKHIASILNYVKDGKIYSEPIRGRFQDARNYLALGIALIDELNAPQTTPLKPIEETFSLGPGDISSFPSKVDKVGFGKNIRGMKSLTEEQQRPLTEPF